MSCSSCNKKNSVKKYSIDSDSLNFLDTLNTDSDKTDDSHIDDMYNLYNDLDKISLNIEDLSYNLPREIVNNQTLIPGMEVRRYLNFTNLKNACDLCNNITVQDRSSTRNINKGSDCYNLMNTSEENMDCFDPEEINVSTAYWINGVREKIINPEYLIPDIFRLCQFNDFSCPSTLQEKIIKKPNKELITILYKIQNPNYNRPKLVKPYVMQSLLYTGVVTNSSNVSDDKYSNNSNNYFMNTDDLCNIMTLLNFNYCSSLNWTIMNIMRYYNNSLLFQIIDLINMCFKANDYYNIGKKLCNYRVPWSSTVTCVTNNDTKCTRNIYYSEIPLTLEQLKIIYSTTIESKNLLYYVNNNINYSSKDNNRLSIVFYYALKVFQDVLLEMKYSMSPYNSIQQSKTYCKKDYMLLEPSKYGSPKEVRIYEQICSYVCAMKYKCIAFNPKYYKYICVELRQMSNYSVKGTYGPSIDDIVSKGGMDNYFPNKQIYTVDTNFIKVDVTRPLAVYGIDECGIGPLRINSDYKINVNVISSSTNKYKLLYLLWDNNKDCSECITKGCDIDLKAFVPLPDNNCNCTVTTSNKPSEYAKHGTNSLQFNIGTLSTNYCLKVLYTKLIENFYVENEKGNKGNRLFDLSIWNNNFEYNYTTNNFKNYYTTFHNKGSTTDTIDLTDKTCGYLDTFELPINKSIDSFNLTSIKGSMKNIMGFGIYSDFVNSSTPKNVLYYSQFFSKKSDGTSDTKGSIIGCNFIKSSNIIAAGSVREKGCSMFYDDYTNNKLYFINVLSYIPTFTFTTLSEVDSLIVDKGGMISSLLSNKNTVSTSSGVYKTEINPDIYMSNGYYNPSGWFFITPKGTIADSSSQSYGFDYLWYPPLDLKLHHAGITEKALPTTYTDAGKGLDIKSGYIYYEKGNNNDALNNIIMKGVDKYFTIDNDISFTTYQCVINRYKSNSMSYYIQEKSIDKVKSFPFILDYTTIDTDPSKSNTYTFKSGYTLKSTTFNTQSIPIKSGLYFNTNNTLSGTIYDNTNSLQLESDNKFRINSTLYYKASSVTLYDNDPIPTEDYPQPYSNSILPYQYQLDYFKTIKSSINTDIISHANVSCIPPKYNYVLPVYKPVDRTVIKVGYYPDVLLSSLKGSIDVYQLAPLEGTETKSIYNKGNSSVKGFPNMNVLYSIHKGVTPLVDVLKNDFYSWGQYSSNFNDKSYTESNSPHFRYTNKNVNFYKDQFNKFKSNGYRLECIENLTTGIITDKANITLTNVYNKGHYISVIPGYDEKGSTKAHLVMYPVIKMSGVIGNYGSSSTKESLNIIKGSVKGSTVTAYYKSDKFSYHYNRYVDVHDKGKSNGMHYTYLGDDSFGIYYYDSLQSNYYPYEKSFNDFSIQAYGNIQVEKGKASDIQYPTKAYSSTVTMFEPIISKGNNDYFFNYYRKINNSDIIKANNNNTYYFKAYKSADTQAISEPTMFNLNYNYISFIQLIGQNTLGNKGDIKSFSISQQVSTVPKTGTITVSSEDEYYGIIPTANYIIEPVGSLSGFSSLMYTLYKAKGDGWSSIKSYTGVKAIFKGIEYDSRISAKLLGKSISVYTNYDTEKYPLLFDRLKSKSSASVDFLKSYNVEPSYSDKNVKSQWPMYVFNDTTSDNKCGLNRSDISSSFILKIGASNNKANYESNKSTTCFPIPPKTVKADTIGMTYISYMSPLKGVEYNKYGLYDRVYCNEGICKSDPLYFAPVTSKSKSTIITQFDTKESDLYKEHMTIKLKGYNTFGGNMSMSNNIMITGTPIQQQTQYYDGDSDDSLRKYSSKGIIYFFDINENISTQSIDDITLLSIKDKYLISSASHYSIYNMDAQNILLFSIDSSINLKGTDPTTGGYKGSMIYQFIEDSGLVFPYMSVSNIADNLVEGSSYLNGYSMDFIESNTQSYSLSSIIGNIPDLTSPETSNMKGSIFFLSNKYDSKDNTSNISNLTSNIYMNDIIDGITDLTFDQFGYKVKTLYVDTQNNAYIMVINKIALIGGQLISHACIIKINVNNMKNKSSIIENKNYISLKGYQIIDASGTVCDGVGDNKRIVLYLSVLEANSSTSYKALNTNIFNTKGNVNNIIQYSFDYDSIEKTYKHTKASSKIFNGFPALTNGEQPYKEKESSVYFGESTADFIGQEDPCYMFGRRLDVVNANMRIPYKDSDETYRTNFLLTNKKYINNKGNIYSTATLYSDRVIEELSHKAYYFKSHNFNNFYTDVYMKASAAITNIELFTYPYKGKGEYYTSPFVNKGSDDRKMDYCSNVIFSKDINNIETTNDCILELPKFMAISNIYVKSIKSTAPHVDDNNETSITIYKSTNSFY
jgi:hypothetical protein